MFKLAYNPTDSPVVVDEAGRSIGGREWGAANSAADEVGQALETGQLVWVKFDPKTYDGGEANAEPDPAALAAVADVDARNELAKLPKAELAEQVADAGDDLTGDESKTELVDKATRRSGGRS